MRLSLTAVPRNSRLSVRRTLIATDVTTASALLAPQCSAPFLLVRSALDRLCIFLFWERFAFCALFVRASTVFAFDANSAQFLGKEGGGTGRGVRAIQKDVVGLSKTAENEEGKRDAEVHCFCLDEGRRSNGAR